MCVIFDYFLDKFTRKEVTKELFVKYGKREICPNNLDEMSKFYRDNKLISNQGQPTILRPSFGDKFTAA